ncbi:GGDEF domain-containing protein [Shumkonia mesophila]|uniref:GGDEF domain-containing protein n=1 Tax=Shumkonia mesophila TaxID=2838854 RepID=UPI0029351175|nr:GGDEF domain-containing protein [Shumkonia mesophila]
MVDVTRSSGVESVVAADGHNRRREPDEQAGSHPREPPPTRRSPRQIHDVAQVMGIPPSEMTPRVQEALGIIVSEYDRARSDLERERERIAFYQDLADKDPHLPLVNQRTLMRELARLIARAAQSRTVSSLAILHIRNLEATRLRHGRAAIDGILRQTAERLSATLRASDIVASLGGTEFAVVLTLTDAAVAAEKMTSLAGLLRAALRERSDPDLPLEIAWGVAAFTAEDDAEKTMEAADSDLRRRSAPPPGRRG